MSLFKRSIEIDVKEESNGIRLTGTLRDRRLGEDLHWLEVSMLVSIVEGEIIEISGRMRKIPMVECAQALEVLNELQGEFIRPGFSDRVKAVVGSNRGCSHLAALLMNMGNVSVQGRGAYMRKVMPDEELAFDAMQQVASELGLVDSCVCWTEDGPIMNRWKEEDRRRRENR